MPHTGRVFDYFDQELTTELATFRPQSLLYVGWRSDCSPWWLDRFREDLKIDRSRVGIIEIYGTNFEEARRRFPEFEVIHGDVREIEKHVPRGKYDLIFWDHGPEHVPTTDLVACTPKLFEHAGKVLLYCCPWGSWPQGPEGGNSAETHHDVEDDTLRNIGMRVRCFGSPGQEKGGELVAWMVK